MAQNIRLQIKRVTKGLNQGVSRIVGQAAFSAFQTIVIASPVDTGHFRNNWQVALNAPKQGIKEGTDPSGQKTITGSSGLFANYKMGESGQANKIFFSNNVPYAIRLNEGHSKQAPAGFVQRALRAGIRAVGAQGKIFR